MHIIFNKNRVLCSLAILVVCLVGDKNSVPLENGDLAAAICDNLTHGIVGVVTWMGVVTITTSSPGQSPYLQIILCGIFSSMIDIDHFILAKSFSLRDATTLTRRPIFHCTTGAVLFCAILLTMAFYLHIIWLYKCGWILLAAVLSHHIRDSTRRGLWMWPFGSTKSVPYIGYIVAEVLLPHALTLLMSSIPFRDTRENVSVDWTIV